MKTRNVLAILLCALTGLVACGQEEPATETAATETLPETVYESPGAPEVVPIDVKYRLLNVPEVGQPVNLELTMVSSVETASFSYALELEDGLMITPSAISMAAQTFSGKPAHSPEVFQVTVTPQREGRFYLRVNANVVTGNQSLARTVIIPIQVGAGTRQLQQHGELSVDEDGRPIVRLPADGN